MEITIIQGKKTEKELKEFIKRVKKIYKPNKITVVKNMQAATKEIAQDIRNW